ncbi:MAG: DUF3800 domain-containing protein [Actinomycetota bacterium]
MLIAYIDESHSDGHYFMGSLVVTPESASLLAFRLDQLMDDIASIHQGIILSSQEFHGTDLWTGKDSWRNISDGVRYRYWIYEKVINSIVECKASIFLQGLDLNSQNARRTAPEPPHDFVLKSLLEKTDRYFEQQGVFGLAICDEIGSTAEMSSQRNNFRSLQKHGIGCNYPRKISRIVDTLHFVSSKESRLIQAIDLVVFLHRRRSVHRFKKESERDEVDRLWALLQPQVLYDRIWRP